MKKFLISVLFVLALVVAVSPAFALQCKEGNYGSDECWTNVKVSASETGVVDAGTILVYDFTSSTGDEDSAFQVRISSANTQNQIVAGVAQQRIATGDRGMVLVRGMGKVKTISAVSSGDRLYVSGTAGKAVVGASVDATSVASHDKAIAFALETSAATATNDAYVVVL